MSQYLYTSPYDSDTCCPSPIPPQWIVDALLTPNHPEKSRATSLIREQISRIEQDIDVTDKTIHELQRRRATLIHERRMLKRLVSVTTRSLPTEILWEIFQFCADTWWEEVDTCVYGFDNNMSGGPRGWEMKRGLQLESGWPGWHSWKLQPIYALSQVCKSWRAAAHSCPKLWSDIFLTLPCVNSVTAPKLLGNQLKLSRNHPLRIHVTSDPNHYILSPSQLRSMHHRWKTITAETLEPLKALSQSNGVSLPLPSLVSLTIVLRDSTPPVSFRLSSADAPLLVDVSLHTWRMGGDIDLELPWAQLRRIRIWSYHSHRAFAIIQNLRKVEDLELQGVDDFDGLPPGPPIVTLPFLHCLRISNSPDKQMDHDSPAIILRYLRLPKLRTVIWTRMKGTDVAQLQTTLEQSLSHDHHLPLLELHLCDYEKITYDHADDELWAIDLGFAVFGLIQRIRSRLEVLTLSCTKPFTSELSYLLRFACDGSMPHLQKLWLQGASLSPDVVAQIAHKANEKQDIRLLNCAFGLGETFWNNTVYHIVQSLSQEPPNAYNFELDIAGPDSRRLCYSPEHGVKIVERCDHCRPR